MPVAQGGNANNMQSHGLTAIAQLSTDDLLLLVDLDETIEIGGSVSIHSIL